MTAIYRYSQERRFAKPPAAIWPFVSDTARLWELSGFAPYRFEERIDAQGRVRRFVRGKVGPFPARWKEDFGEWQEITAFSKSESTKTVRCGAGSGPAVSLPKVRAVG